MGGCGFPALHARCVFYQTYVCACDSALLCESGALQVALVKAPQASPLWRSSYGRTSSARVRTRLSPVSGAFNQHLVSDGLQMNAECAHAAVLQGFHPRFASRSCLLRFTHNERGLRVSQRNHSPNVHRNQQPFTFQTLQPRRKRFQNCCLFGGQLQVTGYLLQNIKLL